jgi:hypothetical protein
MWSSFEMDGFLTTAPVPHFLFAAKGWFPLKRETFFRMVGCRWFMVDPSSQQASTSLYF